ncbi:uncharacterized protein F4812DRAFT_424981 [Daldinia caldariorum]|uniref:uncharacterized protein n=1 Tax=Daldinia caldariorum TaxID=326644 RepID=UPI0020076749|nr:uncharacterized protein F4812DRAFT_424981 [Daldinia caldariorum]KAI1468876.1 hypothetical protein F4812DRAFT_424981 [Daldinia caldariorum]
MKVITPSPRSPLKSPSSRSNHKDEWEDWEESEAEAQKVMEDKDRLLIDLSEDIARKSFRSTTTQSVSRNSIRYSIQKPTRVKSRARQKAQNAKAGIKVVTDMSSFRQPAPPTRQPKFVDTVALHALEGEPSSASIGSFSWLKQRPGNANGARARASSKLVQTSSSDLSPEARPIVIGIAVPSDNLLEHQPSPQTALIETPNDLRRYAPTRENTTIQTPQQLRSVWSPDTEESQSPYHSSRAVSSFYSQPSIYGATAPDADAPPVPALPANLKTRERQSTWLDLDDDDSVGTPCTLFEEDGSPTAVRKSAKPQATIVSPESASSPSRGWWDHITTPFTPQTNNPFKQQLQDTGMSSPPQQWNPFKKQIQETNPSTTTAPPQGWWAGVDEKGNPSQPSTRQQLSNLGPNVSSSPTLSPAPREWWSGTNERASTSSKGLNSNAPAVPQQQFAVQPAATSSRAASPNRREGQAEKARILLEENQKPNEEPPPYSPPKTVNQVKFGVILPPPQVVNSQRVPSPAPSTPNLPGTMTSQGAIGMAEIPLTPSGIRTIQPAVLPDRAPGSYVPGDHFYEIRGHANRTERQRRRHEKEEVAARKVGGFWRGRGCIPEKGCFGRSGREGRKRRRVCLAICGILIAAIILAVLLAVFLTRRRPDENPTPSIWLNLTDFPPMPTGVLTVSGPDNSEAKSGCLLRTPETAWSCSLPKEEHDSVAPHQPDQPEFIFQIQYDNDTRALWNMTNEEQADRKKFLTDDGFTPDPAPPSIAEMRFLGNTTDHIEEDDKAGEPTPFFISLLTAIEKPVGPNMLTRRQGSNDAIGSRDDSGSNFKLNLPPPRTNGDGTVGPAQLFPRPIQQPIRLFDRGLPTEHYGFYTFFDKTIYMVDTLERNSGDEDGGSTLAEAKSIVIFAQTRFLVQIWTRMENTTRLIGGSGGAVPWTNGSAAANTPGTMPYPVTVTEDMHGGDKSKKTTYRYGILDSHALNTTDVQLILSNPGSGGTLVNPAEDADPALGGIDGGTGGCKCEWINFKNLNRVTK